MTISIVTPTFNSMRTIDDYMKAILSQDYPHSSIELIFADGGSQDGTLEKFEEYSKSCDIPIYVYENPLRTAEAGKAVAVRKAQERLFVFWILIILFRIKIGFPE